MRIRRLIHGALLTASLFSIAVPPATAAVGGGGEVHAVSHIEQDAAATTAYWTPARMAAATPVNSRDDETRARPAGPNAPSAQHGGGSKVVGALFHNNGSGDHFCTASVVYTGNHNLLLTAAHCLYDHKYGWGSKLAFVPKYNTSSRAPYGVWPVSTITVDGRWVKNLDQDLDFGFVGLHTLHGRHITDVVGYNSLLTNRGFNNRVMVIGYSAKKYDSTDKPIWCVATTFKQATYQQGFNCPGFYGGTSGSPWMLHYDNGSQSGFVIGTLGGYQQGGAHDWTSYSAVFDNDIKKLMDRANACTRSHCN